jgi:hypothetical protein
MEEDIQLGGWERLLILSLLLFLLGLNELMIQHFSTLGTVT